MGYRCIITYRFVYFVYMGACVGPFTLGTKLKLSLLSDLGLLSWNIDTCVDSGEEHNKASVAHAHEELSSPKKGRSFTDFCKVHVYQLWHWSCKWQAFRCFDFIFYVDFIFSITQNASAFVSCGLLALEKISSTSNKDRETCWDHGSTHF